MIDGVSLSPLKQICGNGGKVMHMLRSTDPAFAGFGEVYFSIVEPGAVKAWKKHLKMTLNIVCIHGSVRFVMYDDRPGSASRGKVQEVLIGPDNYQLVTVPPAVWTGFATAAAGGSIVANCASIPHDPAEVERLDAMDRTIPYLWP